MQAQWGQEYLPFWKQKKMIDLANATESKGSNILV